MHQLAFHCPPLKFWLRKNASSQPADHAGTLDKLCGNSPRPNLVSTLGATCACEFHYLELIRWQTKLNATVRIKHGARVAAYLSQAQPNVMVASRQLKYSCGFLKGCNAGVPIKLHGGFHFLFCFSPHLFLVPGHAASVVTSKFDTFDTPL